MASAVNPAGSDIASKDPFAALPLLDDNIQCSDSMSGMSLPLAAPESGIHGFADLKGDSFGHPNATPSAPRLSLARCSPMQPSRWAAAPTLNLPQDSSVSDGSCSESQGLPLFPCSPRRVSFLPPLAPTTPRTPAANGAMAPVMGSSPISPWEGASDAARASATTRFGTTSGLHAARQMSAGTPIRKASERSGIPPLCLPPSALVAKAGSPHGAAASQQVRPSWGEEAPPVPLDLYKRCIRSSPTVTAFNNTANVDATLNAPTTPRPSLQQQQQQRESTGGRRPMLGMMRGSGSFKSEGWRMEAEDAEEMGMACDEDGEEGEGDYWNDSNSNGGNHFSNGSNSYNGGMMMAGNSNCNMPVGYGNRSNNNNTLHSPSSSPPSGPLTPLANPQTPKPSRKRPRFEESQISALEAEFEIEQELTPARKKEIADELGVRPRQVAVWFQNRKVRFKTRQRECELESVRGEFEAMQAQCQELVGDYQSLRKDYEQLLELNSQLLNKISDFEAGMSPVAAPSNHTDGNHTATTTGTANGVTADGDASADVIPPLKRAKHEPNRSSHMFADDLMPTETEAKSGINNAAAAAVAAVDANPASSSANAAAFPPVVEEGLHSLDFLEIAGHVLEPITSVPASESLAMPVVKAEQQAGEGSTREGGENEDEDAVGEEDFVQAFWCTRVRGSEEQHEGATADDTQGGLSGSYQASHVVDFLSLTANGGGAAADGDGVVQCSGHEDHEGFGHMLW